VYEPITLEIDRAHGEGNYHSYSLYFVGCLIRIVEAGHTKMRLYEWADLGRLLYLVHPHELIICHFCSPLAVGYPPKIHLHQGLSLEKPKSHFSQHLHAPQRDGVERASCP
jgi:hypothetical protein